MTPQTHRPALAAALPFLAALLLALLPAQARAANYVECQHPVVTGVEVYKLHGVKSAVACPVALKLFKWETGGDREPQLYGCHGIGHPYLRRHSFDGWKLKLSPDFVMYRGTRSFAVGGTDFPINCT